MSQTEFKTTTQSASMRGDAKRVRRYILAAWALANLSVVGLVLAYGAHSHEQHMRRAEDLGDNLMHALDQSIMARVERSRVAQETLAIELRQQYAIGGKLDLERVERLATHFSALPEHPVQLRVIDKGGKLVAGAGADANGVAAMNFADRDYMKALAESPEERNYMGRMTTGRLAQAPMLPSAVSYRDADNNFAGVVLEPIPVSELEAIMAQVPLSKGDVFVLRDARDFSMVARKLIGEAPASPPPPKALIDAVAKARADGRDSGHFRIAGSPLAGTVDQAVSFELLRNTPLVLSVGIALDAQLEPWRELAGILAAFAALFFAATSWGAFALSRYDRKARAAEDELALLNANLEAQVKERTEDLAQALETVRRGREELESAERMASLGAMVAGVAHELNTPIGNALLCSSSLVDSAESMGSELEGDAPIRRSTLRAQLARLAELGRSQNDSLARAASLVQAFKQVAADQSSERRREFDLRSTLLSVATAVRPLMARRHSRVEVAVEVPEGLLCDTYAGALTQIVGNLLQNAAAHAFAGRPRGRVAISCSVSEATEAGSPELVTLRVADDGVGLAPGTEEDIFSPNRVLKGAGTSSGVGLSLSRKLAERGLGGSLRAERASSGGAVFVLSFPRRAI